MRKLRALAYGLGAVWALSHCGPLSSRDAPGQSSAQGGDGGDDVSGGTMSAAGSTASVAGEPSASGTGGASGGGAPSEVGGAAGESGEGGHAGEPEPDGPITIAENQSAPTGIAIDAQYVYWANRDAGTIVRCPLRGCGDQPPKVLAKDVASPLGVTVDATSLYWVNKAVMEEGMNVGRIYKCPISGCPSPGPTLVTIWQVGNQTNDLHVVGNLLYVAAWPMLGTCSTEGCAMPTNIGGGPFMAVDTNDAHIFASFYGWSELHRCPLTGCSGEMPLKLATKVRAKGITVDDSFVYFTNDYSDAMVTMHDVEKCPLDGCGDSAPEVVVPGDGMSPHGLTSSSTRLYFTNVEHGTVLSVPK